MRSILQVHVNVTLTNVGGGGRGLDWCIVLGQLSTIERSIFKLRNCHVCFLHSLQHGKQVGALRTPNQTW